MNFKKKNFKKKGELTTQQIVMLIVLLASFIILLLFLVKTNFQKTSEKDICYSSIQMVGRQSFFGSIDCKTNYLCISGGEECGGFLATETVKINLNNEGYKEQIMRALANEMADCWWMFGEGKVDYADWSGFGSRQCAVCTEIAFDEKLAKEQDPIIKYEEFYEFLKKTYVSENKQVTYFEYLKSVDLDILKENEIINVTGDYIDFDKKYGIYTGRDKSSIVFKFTSAYGDVEKNSISPIILDRTKSNRLGCTFFITTP